MLSFAWSLITPLFMLLVYGLVLTRGANVTGDGIPYLAFAWTGLVVWTFFASALNAGTNSLLVAGYVITKVYFPRSVVPFAAVLVAGAESLAAIGIMLVVAFVQTGTTMFTPALAALPLILWCLAVWVTALALLLSVAAVFVRDLTYAVTIILQVGFFATPVMYPISFLGPLSWLAVVNPVAVVITSLRDVLLQGLWPEPLPLLAQAAAGTVLLLAVVAYVRAVEHRIADVI